MVGWQLVSFTSNLTACSRHDTPVTFLMFWWVLLAEWFEHPVVYEYLKFLI